MQKDVHVIKPGYYKVKADADARRDEFDEKNTELLQNGTVVDLLLTGDSITHFMDEQKYYGQFGTVVNRGIGGDLVEVLAWRFCADVTQLRPRLCVVLVGVNNTWLLDNNINKTSRAYNKREKKKVLDLFEKSYRSMLEEARDNGYPLWVASCLPVRDKCGNHDLRNLLIVEMNEILKRLCSEYGTKYVDYHSHIVKEDGITMDDACSDDGVHPNPTGYTRMSEVLTPMLKEFYACK